MYRSAVLRSGAFRHDTAVTVKLRGDQKPEQFFADGGNPRRMKERDAFFDFALNDSIKITFQTAPRTAAKKQNRFFIMLEYQVKNRYGFVPHRGFQPHRKICIRTRIIIYLFQISKPSIAIIENRKSKHELFFEKNFFQTSCIFHAGVL